MDGRESKVLARRGAAVLEPLASALRAAKPGEGATRAPDEEGVELGSALFRAEEVSDRISSMRSSMARRVLASAIFEAVTRISATYSSSSSWPGLPTRTEATPPTPMGMRPSLVSQKGRGPSLQVTQ